MPIVTVDRFLQRYPEFNPLKDSGLIEQILPESAQDCLEQAWKDKRDRAVMLLTAHHLTVRWIQIGEIAGQAYGLVTGEEGATTLKEVKDELETTTYGRQLKRLQLSLLTSSLGTANASIFTF